MPVTRGRQARVISSDTLQQALRKTTPQGMALTT
jgi:hypothetical protein